MITKDLITLQIKSEGVDKVTIDLDKLAKGIKEIELEAKDAKAGIRGLKDENKALKDQNEENVRLIKQFSAELKQLQQQGQGASNRAKQLSQNVQKLNQDIDNNTTQIDKNNASINTLQNASEALIRTMKIEDMTMNQLSRRAEYLRAKLGNISKSAEPGKWKKYNDQLVATEEQMKKVAIGGEQVQNRFSQLGKAAQEAGKTIGKVFLLMAAYSVLRFFQDLVAKTREWVAEAKELAAKAEGVSRAFESLNKPKLLDNLREQTRGLIGDFELMQAAVKADKYKIPVDQVGNLLEFASRRAIDMGQNVDDFQKRIINGIGKQSKLILDDLGFSSVEINKAIAKQGSFAKGVISLVNEELEKQGPRALTAADIAVQSSVKWQNAQLKVGNQFLWIDKLWSKLSGKIADWVTQFAERQLPDIMNKLINLYNHFVTAYNGSELLRVSVYGIAFGFKLLYNNMKLVFDFGINQAILLGKTIDAALSGNVVKLSEAVVEYAVRNKTAYKDYLKSVKDDFKSLAESTKGSKLEYVTPVSGETMNNISSGPIADEDKKALQKQKKELEIILENLETTHRKRLADIRQKYITGDIKSESEYNQKIFLQDQAYHMLREQALEEFLKKTTIKELKSDISKQIADQQDKRLDQQVKYQAKLEKIILDANPEEKEKKEYEDRLRDLEIYGKSRQELQMLLMSAETEDEKNILKKKLEAFELLEQQHQENLLKIRNDSRAKEKAKGEEEFQEKFGKDKAEKQKAIEDETNQFSLDKEIGAYTPTEAFDAEVELQKKRLELIQEELEARKAAGLDISMILRKQASEEANLTKIYTSEFNRRKQEYSQYGNAIGTVLGNVISGQEDALKGFADVMLDILFDTLTQMINAEIIKVVATGTGAIARSTAEAMAAPDSVLSFGATGFARIAILTAVITGAMMAAKTSLKGLLGGGKSDSSSSTSTSNRTRVATGFEKGGKIDVVRSQDGRKYSAVYDPDRRGFIDEPTVLVGDGPVGKRKEWIASNPLYENPTARPIIDLLDEAQRSGRVSTIDMNQLMRARMAGFESGGFPSRPSSSLSQPIVNSNVTNARYNTRELILLNDTLGRVGQILDRVEANGLGVNYQALKETTVKMTEIESYGKK